MKEVASMKYARADIARGSARPSMEHLGRTPAFHPHNSAMVRCAVECYLFEKVSQLSSQMKKWQCSLVSGVTRQPWSPPGDPPICDGVPISTTPRPRAQGRVHPDLPIPMVRRPRGMLVTGTTAARPSSSCATLDSRPAHFLCLWAFAVASLSAVWTDK